jgi:hypothetical protein
LVARAYGLFKEDQVIGGSQPVIFFMVDEKQLARWQAPYAQLRGLLAQADWISEGYVQDRGSPLFPVEFNSVRDQH